MRLEKGLEELEVQSLLLRLCRVTLLNILPRHYSESAKILSKFSERSRILSIQKRDPPQRSELPPRLTVVAVQERYSYVRVLHGPASSLTRLNSP